MSEAGDPSAQDETDFDPVTAEPAESRRVSDAEMTALVDELLGGLVALASADFDVRMERSGYRDTRDTVAFLFNAVAENVHDLVESLRRERQDVERGVEELSEVLTRLASADFEARADRRMDGSPLDVLAFLINATSEELGGAYARLREQNAFLERQARDALDQRLATTHQLAAGVGHELRNPLAVAAGNVDIVIERMASLVDGDLPDDISASLIDTRLAIQRATKIADELALMSPAKEAEFVYVRLEKVVRSAFLLVRNAVAHRAVVTIDSAAGDDVLIDDARIGQVIINLVQNAAQAMPVGRPADQNTIAVWTGPISDTECMVRVTDNGSGMAPDVAARIFEAYYTTRALGEGSGLGLAISQQIVAAHDGRIEVSSVEGVGSEFRVVLPRVAPPVAVDAASPTPVAAVDEDGCRVLVIDDEPLISTMVRRILGEKFEVVTAVSGLDGLQVALEGAFGAVVCDVMMPDMSGPEIYRRLVDADATSAGRFAFMTGGVFTAAEKAFLEGTGVPVLMKPFTRAELLEAIAHIRNRPES